MSVSKEIVITVPDEVAPYADDIRRFMHAMVYKLKVHHKKGRWESIDLDKALALMKDEVKELEDAIAGGNLIEILTEAADVGNYGMIVAAIATERGQ